MAQPKRPRGPSALQAAGDAQLRRRSRALPGGRLAAQKRAVELASAAPAPATSGPPRRWRGGGPRGNQGFPRDAFYGKAKNGKRPVRSTLAAIGSSSLTQVVRRSASVPCAVSQVW